MSINIYDVSIVILAATILSVSGCSGDDQEKEVRASRGDRSAAARHDFITVTDSSDARQDFQEAIARGDRRFIAVMGFTLVVPGVDDFDRRFGSLYGVKIVEGTSDSHSDSVSLAMQVRAEKYAREYNRLLLEYLE